MKNARVAPGVQEGTQASDSNVWAEAFDQPFVGYLLMAISWTRLNKDIFGIKLGYPKFRPF